jgi:asparagine synthase (glutamine-hydrolysing)
MAYSLESRSPFLDVRFAEFMARVPARLKVRGRQLRYLERKLAERYLPREVLARKKQGFASPLMYIMNDEVRRLAPRLLVESELARDGYLRKERVQELVKEHLEGRRDHGNRIWLLLTAEIWYRHFVGGRSASDLEAELAAAGGKKPKPAKRAG